MTPEERAHYDARASEEAWDHALRILRPWVEMAHQFGSGELTRIMEKALEEAEMEWIYSADVLKALEAGMTPHEFVLDELARSRKLSGIEDLRERLKAAGHPKTAKKLLEEPPYGWGEHVDEVLKLAEGERRRAARAWGATFLSPRR